MNQMTDDDMYGDQMSAAMYEMWYNQCLKDFIAAGRNQTFYIVLSELFDHVDHAERNQLFDAFEKIVNEG